MAFQRIRISGEQPNNKKLITLKKEAANFMLMNLNGIQMPK